MIRLTSGVGIQGTALHVTPMTAGNKHLRDHVPVEGVPAINAIGVDGKIMTMNGAPFSERLSADGRPRALIPVPLDGLTYTARR